MYTACKALMICLVGPSQGFTVCAGICAHTWLWQHEEKAGGCAGTARRASAAAQRWHGLTAVLYVKMTA